MRISDWSADVCSADLADDLTDSAVHIAKGIVLRTGVAEMVVAEGDEALSCLLRDGDQRAVRRDDDMNVLSLLGRLLLGERFSLVGRQLDEPPQRLLGALA